MVIGDEKIDVGLAVKNGRGPLCVPDYTKPAPSGTGWQYSQALAAILTQYKARQIRVSPDLRRWQNEYSHCQSISCQDGCGRQLLAWWRCLLIQLFL